MIMDKKEKTQYRTHNEITALVIEFALRNEKIACYGVIYSCGLNSDQAKSYLEELERKGFLKSETKGKKRVYIVANRSKCERWLGAFKRWVGALKILKAIEEES